VRAADRRRSTWATSAHAVSRWGSAPPWRLRRRCLFDA
jgi:hypothetical protein